VQHIVSTKDFLKTLKEEFKNFNISKVKIPKVKKDRKKKGTILELMLSDLHFGKLTENFNQKVAEERMSKLSRVFMNEIDTQKTTYNIDEVVIGLIGDIIESSTMHGEESLIG